MRRRAALYASFALLLLIVSETLSYLGLVIGERWFGEVRRVAMIYKEQTEYILKLVNEADGPRREVLDPQLGWRYRPGYHKGDDIINSQGLRSAQVYSSRPRDGILRVASFGDSFVYGNEVGTLDVWSSQMEKACPAMEVLNYGVGGYGVDQAYLRYESEGARHAPEVVLIGFVPDDIRRLVNVYRRFIDDHELPLFKPRFILEDAGLFLTPNPVPAASDYRKIVNDPSLITQIGRNDYWYHPVIYENPMYDLSATVRLAVVLGIRIQRRYFDRNAILEGDVLSQHSEAFKIQLALFQKFVEVARNRNVRPYVVLFPQKDDVLRVQAGKGTTYELLARELDRLHLPYVDIIDSFSGHPLERIDSFFMPGGHYSRTGNQVVAERLLGLFQSEVPAGC